MADNRTTELTLIREESYQLAERVLDLRSQYEEITTRAEQILFAGACLNMDFFALIPQEVPIFQPSGDNMFKYIDAIRMEIVFMERLADTELMA